MTVQPSAPVATSALTITAAFAEQVVRHGSRPAVVDGERVLTYAQLYAACIPVAAVIEDAASSPEPTAAILANHGADLVVAILGALEAGRMVVVLDPADPPDRLRELLAEAQAGVVLADAAQASLASEVAGSERRVVRLDAVAAADTRATTAIARPLDPEAPAFVLFTSGTTGRAKGVLATHANIVRNVRNYAHSAGLGPDDRLSLLSRTHYMAGLSALFGGLLNGAAVAPFDVRSRGFRDLHDWIQAERLTVLHAVPTLFRRFCESLEPTARFDAVRIVKLGGEPVMNHDLKLWRRHFSPASVLINGLGLSEANGNLCHWKIQHGAAGNFDVVPVGWPLPGVDILLLDEAGRPVQDGDAGEIAFRCPHRSPGYWRSDQFAARLVRPVPADEGAPFFLTGDLGRIRADGCLQHLGRKDDLLKVRGVRIEPAQVEAVLLQDSRIRHCAVGVHGEGSGPQQLVAWIVPSPGTVPTSEDLRGGLAGRLPPALVPALFVPLDALPMTPGGKIDRKALPAPRSADADPTSNGTEQPSDALELALIPLWRKLLRVKQVAPSDDFFSLGGDSLLAAVMVSKAEAQFRAEVDVSAFLTSPTIRDLAAQIRSTTADPTHQRLVLTHRGGPGTPYFFVPGAGAVGRTLSPASDWGSRSRYWYQHAGIDGVEPPQRSIPEMARSFVREVRKVQPHGPYLLGGGSFGALVALEAVHQLVDAGEKVRLLVVEDPLLDGCLLPRTGGRWTDPLERSLLWLLPVGKRFEWSWAGVRDGLRQWGHRLVVPVARWRARRQEKPLSKIHRFHDVLNHSLAAKRGHVPRPYGGAVVLLRTRFRTAQRLFDLDPMLGWGAMCPGLRTIQFDEEKGDRLRDPQRQAAYLACLAALLDNAEREGADGPPDHHHPTADARPPHRSR